MGGFIKTFENNLIEIHECVKCNKHLIIVDKTKNKNIHINEKTSDQHLKDINQWWNSLSPEKKEWYYNFSVTL